MIKRVVSLLFVLIMVFNIFSVPIYATEEIEQIEMFEYYYKNEGTFEILESVLVEYNKKFGYEVERKIRMGSDDEEFTAAEFDEEKITIYCSFIEGSSTKEKIKYKSINKFLDEVIELCDEEEVHNFIFEISEVSPYLGSIMLPMLLDNNTGYLPPSYKIFHTIVSILNVALGYISLSYLIYILIFLIYCKIKKIKIKNIKRKVIFSLLSAFYLFVGGLSNIIPFILSLTI